VSCQFFNSFATSCFFVIYQNINIIFFDFVTNIRDNKLAIVLRLATLKKLNRYNVATLLFSVGDC